MIRLHKNPIFYIVEGLSGVGTFNEKEYFVCFLMTCGKDGKSYPGYYAFFRGKKTFSTRGAATTACKRWLGHNLI